MHGRRQYARHVVGGAGSIVSLAIEQLRKLIGGDWPILTFALNAIDGQ